MQSDHRVTTRDASELKPVIQIPAGEAELHEPRALLQVAGLIYRDGCVGGRRKAASTDPLCMGRHLIDGPSLAMDMLTIVDLRAG